MPSRSLELGRILHDRHMCHTGSNASVSIYLIFLFLMQPKVHEKVL